MNINALIPSLLLHHFFKHLFENIEKKKQYGRRFYGVINKKSHVLVRFKMINSHIMQQCITLTMFASKLILQNFKIIYNTTLLIFCLYSLEV